jgi:hypothetical protein
MAGLKLDMKLDTQRNLAPLIDVGIVILVAVVIVVAAGSNITLPVVGVIALWAGYYLYGLEWAGGQTLGKRIAGRSEAKAPKATAAPAPAETPAPAANEHEEEPADEMGGDLVSPALRELIADLETAKGNAKGPEPEEAEPAEEEPELEPAAQAKADAELEHEAAEPEAEAAGLEPVADAEDVAVEDAEAEDLDVETAEAEAQEPEVEAAPEPASRRNRRRVEAFEADDDIDEATVEALLEEESPADATRK